MRTFRLEELLRCPTCCSELTRANETLTCRGCARVFSRRNGVPLLIDPGSPELAQVTNVGSTGLTAALPARMRPWARRLRNALHADVPYKSGESRTRIARALSDLPADATALNIGSGEIDYGPHVINIDVDAFDGVHVVAVGEALPFPADSVDAVVYEGVLNVLADCRAALREAHRVLRPGGLLICDVPFLQGYNPSPDDYRRFTRSGLAAELDYFGFTPTASGVSVGPASAVARITPSLLAMVVSGPNPRVFRWVRFGLCVLLNPLKYADRWLERHPMAESVASGVWATGRKRDAKEVFDATQPDR